MDSNGNQTPFSKESSCTKFWGMPVAVQNIVLVAEEVGFEKVVQTLKSAAIVGLDCEWRPVANKRSGAASRGSPRVAVLQIAIRRRGSKKADRHEEVFVLDMLALKPATFAAPLKAMLSSPHILKLGYAFKDDLRHLAASHPGVDARGCFDKVDNFVDLGKLFHTVRGNSDTAFVGTGGLSAIANAILGLPLDKELQCSDWEMRPLLQSQLLYAATDAYCLLPIYDALVRPFETTAQEDKGPSRQPPRKVLPSLSIAAALDLNPPETSQTSADVSIDPSPSATCLLSSRGIAPAEAATAASLAAAGIDGTADDVAVAMGRFAERLSLSSINQEAGSKKTKKRPGSKPRRPPGESNGQDDVDDCEWLGPPPWEEEGASGEPRFLCDVHVEGLARQLRCVGFDTASAPGPRADPRQMVEQAEREGRVLLTRDRRLIRRRLLPLNKAYLVKALGKQAQLKEVLAAFKLGVRARRLLCRCIRCNGDFVTKPLNPQEAAAAAPWSQVIPECALRAHTEFWQCSVCRHVYWEGTQFQRAILQFEAAFEGIMEGTVAEDRFTKPSNATGCQTESVSDANRAVGYCTEPEESDPRTDEVVGPLGPLNDLRKEGSKVDTGTRSGYVGRVDSGVHRTPCKSCAERRKKKAERRQSASVSSAAEF